MLAIKNAILVLKDHYLCDATLLAENGKIVDFGKNIEIPAGAEVVDAEGLYVGPGLVDIHTHSDGDTLFTEDPVKASAFLLKHGVTAVLPALYFNMSAEEYLASFELIEKARKEGKAPNIRGYYMEGPYLNPKFGADRDHNKWGGPIDRNVYMPIVETFYKEGKVWCVAPEREGIEEFVKDVKKKNPGAVFTVAHSEAEPWQIEKLIPYGLRIATHHTNATGKNEKYPECHGVCVDECVWQNDCIYAELICDSVGIHVDPYMLRLVRRIKGDEKIILISDAFVPFGPVPPGYDGVTDINFDAIGEISGSKLTLDIACRNMMMHTGASVLEVFRFASFNPATAAGLDGLGEIRKGADADLIFVDHLFHVKKTFIKGELQ